MWFKNEACEALARETGFIQRSTSRLTGSLFFNLLTVEILDEPTVSYEGLCDILEERHPDVRITPQALCARMNSEGAVEFLKAGLARTLKETARQPLAALEGTAWLAAFPRVLLQDSTQMQIHEKMADDFKGSKHWKSLFRINVLQGARTERILCLIYGRLIVILVAQRLLALASTQAVGQQRELSFTKARQWLLRGGRLLKAFLDRQFGGLIKRMVSRLQWLLKQKRERLTTRQLVARQVAYLDSLRMCVT